MKEPPTILGYDVAGEVVDVGPEVDNYKKGDRMSHLILAITND